MPGEAVCDLYYHSTLFEFERAFRHIYISFQLVQFSFFRVLFIFSLFSVLNLFYLLNILFNMFFPFYFVFIVSKRNGFQNKYLNLVQPP